MAERNARLDQILNDPEKLAQVMEIAKQLMGNAGTDSGTDGQPAAESSTGGLAAAEAGLGGLGSLLSGLDVGSGAGETVARAISGLNGSQKRVSLLTAVLPFVSEERREIVRRAISAMKLAGAARAALGGVSEHLGGETRHV